jgi:hypothetical protein
MIRGHGRQVKYFDSKRRKLPYRHWVNDRVTLSAGALSESSEDDGPDQMLREWMVINLWPVKCPGAKDHKLICAD